MVKLCFFHTAQETENKLAFSSLVSPKRVVGCRGGRRYVEGWWGFPYVKMKMFLGLLVCWSLGGCFCGCLVYWLLVSWFLDFRNLSVSKGLGFLVAKFTSCRAPLFEVSKFRNIFNVLLEEIAPTLPKFHFIVFERYWSRIRDFQNVITRIVGVIRRPPFPIFSKCSMSKISRFIKMMFPKTIWGVFLDF